jgi:hypothetical protein
MLFREINPVFFQRMIRNIFMRYVGRTQNSQVQTDGSVRGGFCLKLGDVRQYLARHCIFTGSPACHINLTSQAWVLVLLALADSRDSNTEFPGVMEVCPAVTFFFF